MASLWTSIDDVVSFESNTTLNSWTLDVKALISWYIFLLQTGKFSFNALNTISYYLSLVLFSPRSSGRQIHPFLMEAYLVHGSKKHTCTVGPWIKIDLERIIYACGNSIGFRWWWLYESKHAMAWPRESTIIEQPPASSRQDWLYIVSRWHLYGNSWKCEKVNAYCNRNVIAKPIHAFLELGRHYFPRMQKNHVVKISNLLEDPIIEEVFILASEVHVSISIYPQSSTASFPLLVASEV